MTAKPLSVRPLSVKLDETRFAFGLFITIVAVLTFVRIAVLFASPLNLGPDEAQYWFWSLEPAFGYFSKPPLVAWSIGATTAICGDAEACVRLSSPLYAAATAGVIFAIALRLFGARAAFWAGLIFATLPASFFSALLMTTDVPLLFFWSLTLLGLSAIIFDDKPPGVGIGISIALGTGLAAGLGFLAKYAMGYAFLCLGLVALVDRRARARLVGRDGALMLGAFALTISPNILWNAAHGFPTFRHTAENANWQADNFNLAKLGEFAGAQIGLLGPVTVIVLLMIALRLWKTRKAQPAAPDATRIRFLLLFSLPILFIGLAQSFISRANANWAAPSFVAAVIAVGAVIATAPRLRLPLGLILPHVVIGIFLYCLAISPALVTALGRENDVKRLRGWDVQAGRVIDAARAMNATVILSDDREDMASLLYYTRDSDIPVRMWLPDRPPQNHFEMFFSWQRTPGPLTPITLAYVTRRKNPETILDAVGGNASAPLDLTEDLGGGKSRVLKLFRIETRASRE